MSSITFIPDKREEQAEQGETILETAQRTGIPLTHVCMGNARCSTCRIKIVEGIENVSPRNGMEQEIAEQMSFGDDIRLACQTKITGNVKVRRLVLDPDDIEVTSLIIQESGSSQVGIEKEVVILMADIRDFTSLAGTLLPYDILHILNRYFYLMNEVITHHGGRIDNYMGDGFIALFDVTDCEKDVLRAIHAGLEMLDVVNQRIKPYVKEYFGRRFKIGIGLHYGLVIAGMIGSRGNKRHTIIGDAVNFTSRIESINKQLGTQFLISEDIYSVIQKSIRIHRTHTIKLRGKTGLHTVYEVVGLL